MTNQIIYDLPEFDADLAAQARLTDNQRDIWYLRSEMGMTDRQIAQSKKVGTSTITKTRKIIHRKLELSDSPGVLEIADEMGVDAGLVSHGWMKSDEGSFFFKSNPEISQDQFVDIIKGVFDGEIERPSAHFKYSSETVSSDLMTKYVIADFHLGMLAWAEESGEDWDMTIAMKTFTETMETVIQSTPASGKALIVNLGDFFHNNDSKGITPMSGHILDMDSRAPKIAAMGIRAMRYLLERAAEKHGSVDYVSVAGNHDIDQSYWLNLALMEAYSDHPAINIIWNPAPFYAYEFGLNMIGMAHGDRTNFNRLAFAMADNHSEMWGRTKFRVLDTGHVHHQREQDIGGVLVRSHRTMAAKDAYAAKGAYSAHRRMSAYTYHKTQGEILVNSVNFPKSVFKNETTVN